MHHRKHQNFAEMKQQAFEGGLAKLDNDNDTLKEVHPTIVSGLAFQA